MAARRPGERIVKDYEERTPILFATIGLARQTWLVPPHPAIGLIELVPSNKADASQICTPEVPYLLHDQKSPETVLQRRWAASVANVEPKHWKQGV